MVGHFQYDTSPCKQRFETTKWMLVAKRKVQRDFLMRNIDLTVAMLVTVIVVAGNCAVAAEAPQATTIDVTKFDVGGVRLGMTMEQATDALIRVYGIARSDIQVGDQNPVGPQDIKEILYFKQGNFSIDVRMSRVIVNGGVPSESVVSITYVRRDNAKPDSAIIDGATAKYGRPSVEIKNVGHSLEWCSKVKTFGVKQNPTVTCDRNGPELVVTEGSVTLKDPESEERNRQNWESAMAKPAVHPKF
jgi:hypothetical protein